MPEEDARYHMKRCIDSGLWVPQKNGGGGSGSGGGGGEGEGEGEEETAGSVE
jgi:cell division cycle protein 37